MDDDTLALLAQTPRTWAAHNPETTTAAHATAIKWLSMGGFIEIRRTCELKQQGSEITLTAVVQQTGLQTKWDRKLFFAPHFPVEWWNADKGLIGDVAEHQGPVTSLRVSEFGGKFLDARLRGKPFDGMGPQYMRILERPVISRPDAPVEHWLTLDEIISRGIVTDAKKTLQNHLANPTRTTTTPKRLPKSRPVQYSLTSFVGWYEVEFPGKPVYLANEKH